MKKNFLTTMIIACTFMLAGPVMAKGAKAPKNFCLISQAPPFSIALSISKSGKIVLGGDKIESYTIQGIMFHGGASFPVPITGAGYIGDTLFQFTFSGTFPTGGTIVSIEGTLLWEVTSVLAEGVLIYNASSGIVNGSQTVLSIVNCDGP